MAGFGRVGGGRSIGSGGGEDSSIWRTLVASFNQSTTDSISEFSN